ncbi:MAG: pilus assembly protein [Cocleimonas sp.]|nr:pilus assembly protein [Cocleimonas sp.]
MMIQKKQSGVVLISSLLLIIILTLLVFSAAQDTILQNKMSGNLRERDLAFQSAETALLTGEKYLQKTEPLPVFNNSSGKYTFSKTRGFAQESEWSSLTTIQYDHSLHQVQSIPKYLIEKISLIDTIGESLDASTPVESNYYRITSRSVNGDATVILQSVYRR